MVRNRTTCSLRLLSWITVDAKSIQVLPAEDHDGQLAATAGFSKIL